MKPSSGNSDKPDPQAKTLVDLNLEFPVDPGFESKTIPMTADALYRATLEILKRDGLPPNFMEDRLRDKCYEEFKM